MYRAPTSRTTCLAFSPLVSSEQLFELLLVIFRGPHICSSSFLSFLSAWSFVERRIDVVQTVQSSITPWTAQSTQVSPGSLIHSGVEHFLPFPMLQFDKGTVAHGKVRHKIRHGATSPASFESLFLQKNQRSSIDFSRSENSPKTDTSLAQLPDCFEL